MKRAQAELPSFYYRNYTTCPASCTGCALVNSVVGSVIYPSYIKADSNKWILLCWNVELSMELGEVILVILRLLVIACPRTHQHQHHLRSYQWSSTDWRSLCTNTDNGWKVLMMGTCITDNLIHNSSVLINSGIVSLTMNKCNYFHKSSSLIWAIVNNDKRKLLILTSYY